MKKLLVLIIAAALLWTASGVYFVQPDEQAVVRRFGRLLQDGPREPGAHFGLPWGLDRVDRVKTREVRRVDIGPVSLGGSAAGSAAAQFLTGDRNLVDVQATVQYTIRDPVQYLMQTERVDSLVMLAGEASLAAALLATPVDAALTEGKQQIGVQVGQHLQELLDHYQLGVTVRSVDIGRVAPPAEVARAFEDVIAALRQRQQAMNEATSYSNRAIEQARADAQRQQDQAHGWADNLLRQTEGEVQRFEQLRRQFEASPQLTAQRLYLETMAETLPRFRSKLIVDSDGPLDLSIFPEQQP